MLYTLHSRRPGVFISLCLTFKNARGVSSFFFFRLDYNIIFRLTVARRIQILNLLDKLLSCVCVSYVRTSTLSTPVVTLCTTSLKKILLSDHTVYLCLLCGSENRQPLFPHTTLRDSLLGVLYEVKSRMPYVETRCPFSVHL